MRRFVSIRSASVIAACWSSLPFVVLLNLCFVTAPALGVENSDIDALGLPRADSVVDVQTLLHRAERGDARASFLLGTRYSSGRAGVRDDSEAVRWFTQAAEAGLAEAEYNLGIMYASGRGVARNMVRAAHWYERAAKQGVVEAQYNLGTLYGVGLGVEKNERVAADWLRRAADRGLTEAEFNLGVLFEHGRGVRLDGKAAMDWYRRAARKGYEPAKKRLGALQQKLGIQPDAVSVPARETPSEVAQSDQQELEPGLAALQSNQWINSLDPERYTLQLMSQTSEPRAIGFIRDRQLGSDAAYFVWQKEGATWYSIIYGVYDSFEQATAAGGSLPPAIADVKPWVRRIAVIQELIER